MDSALTQAAQAGQGLVFMKAMEIPRNEGIQVNTMLCVRQFFGPMPALLKGVRSRKGNTHGHGKK